ncbi:DUF4843 domain-containing protein [Bacteroides sp. 1001136B_160425_E2]|uniref:DUF4843 domain-containing protein n=1 Tax=Bacteroides sp. 1001136B_160425_E2 TaxID=2787083 RepID=UPI00189FF26E|nr:DUF4843 domain-containing protein [Bacteroides sp. 1001136B_160425_E2]
MNSRNIFLIIIGCLIITFFSCEEKGLLVNANDVSYIIFEKDMMTDTTTTSFTFYEEGEDAKVDLDVQIYGKLREVDTKFTVAVDEKGTTIPKGYYVLPSECMIEAGKLKGTITVTLKNFPDLKTSTKLLAIKINESGDIRPGTYRYSKAIISVTDRLFKPDWWSVNDRGNETRFENTIEKYYLGTYSEKKYKMFLEELIKDDVVFNGKDMQVMRKYALRLKNTLKELKAAGTPALDENENEITVVVAG